MWAVRVVVIQVLDELVDQPSRAKSIAGDVEDPIAAPGAEARVGDCQKSEESKTGVDVADAGSSTSFASAGHCQYRCGPQRIVEVLARPEHHSILQMRGECAGVAGIRAGNARTGCLWLTRIELGGSTAIATRCGGVLQIAAAGPCCPPDRHRLWHTHGRLLISSDN
jgi:hypothetical protein